MVLGSQNGVGIHGGITSGRNGTFFFCQRELRGSELKGKKLTCHVSGKLLTFTNAITTNKNLNTDPQPGGPVGVNCISLLSAAITKLSGVSSRGGCEEFDIYTRGPGGTETLSCG